MKSRSITYTKNHFSAIVREVREGKAYLVCDHDKPVAILAPVKEAGEDINLKSLAAMEKDGLVRRGKGSLSQEFFSDVLTGPPSGCGAVEALLDEREEGR